jgi:hypothetical protein
MFYNIGPCMAMLRCDERMARASRIRKNTTSEFFWREIFFHQNLVLEKSGFAD